MALVTLKQILLETREKKYAVPSIGADNHVLFEAVLAQAEEENKPVILMIPGFLLSQLDARFFDYAGKESSCQACRSACIWITLLPMRNV